MLALRRMSLWMLALATLGCSRTPPEAKGPRPPEVLVGEAIVRSVTDYEIFTGRTEASERVEIRARVTGYLDKSLFAEGAMVQRGDVLFQIDPRPLAAELARAEAALAQSRAHLERLDRDYARHQPLVTKGALSREEFDKLSGDRDEARAAVGVAEANVQLARLNLAYTDVRAPFSGRISRRLVDPGSLVKADETILTYLVAVEPLHVYFDVDERTLLRQLLQAGRLESARQDRIPIEIGLADEDDFPHRGIVNFVDNRVDPNTGTLWMRGELTEAKRPVAPGMFARIRFPLGDAYETVLVAEQAFGIDQGQRFVYVLDADNKAAVRPVKVGRLHHGLRAVRDGLKPGERVVVSGLQRVRPGGEVIAKPIDMAAAVLRPNNHDLTPDGSPTRPFRASSNDRPAKNGESGQ
jgi:RND family efflux transporter MFP subunit